MCWPKTRMKYRIQWGNIHVCKHNQRCWNIHRMKSWVLVVGVWSFYGVCIFCPEIAASKCVPRWEIRLSSPFHIALFIPSTLSVRAHTHTQKKKLKKKKRKQHTHTCGWPCCHSRLTGCSSGRFDCLPCVEVKKRRQHQMKHHPS